MANKPKLNDLIKANPEKEFSCAIASPGRRGDGPHSPYWLYTVVYNNAEYAYFANDEYHAQDIDRFVNAGKTLINLSMVKELIDGKTAYHWMAHVDGQTSVQAGTPHVTPQQEVQPRQSAPQSQSGTTPNWDEISRGKCRHAYAVEVFKGLIADKKPLVITPQIAMVIDAWTDYSMTSKIVVDFQDPKVEDDPSVIPF